MGCSNVQKPVFVDTNLGTHLAVPISPDITAKEFMVELELAHLNCFPEFGSISVTAVMVKQKSRLYHLSESLPLKYAFTSSKSSCWFLQSHAHSNPFINGNHKNPTQVDNFNSADENVVTDSVVEKETIKNVKKIKNKTGSPVQQQQLPLIEKENLCQFAMTTRDEETQVNLSNDLEKNDMTAEAPIEKTFSESESISVSGIINKYFSDYDEVASSPPLFPFSTVWSRDNKDKLKSDAFESKDSKPRVGKRVLSGLDRRTRRLIPSNQGSALSLSRCTSNVKSPNWDVPDDEL
ncbi:hypothetical protein ABFS83_01G110900 [Erythranthe nasuta]